MTQLQNLVVLHWVLLLLLLNWVLLNWRLSKMLLWTEVKLYWTLLLLLETKLFCLLNWVLLKWTEAWLLVLCLTFDHLFVWLFASNNFFSQIVFTKLLGFEIAKSIWESGKFIVQFSDTQTSCCNAGPLLTKSGELVLEVESGTPRVRCTPTKREEKWFHMFS